MDEKPESIELRAVAAESNGEYAKALAIRERLLLVLQKAHGDPSEVSDAQKIRIGELICHIATEEQRSNADTLVAASREVNRKRAKLSAEYWEDDPHVRLANHPNSLAFEQRMASLAVGESSVFAQSRVDMSSDGVLTSCLSLQGLLAFGERLVAKGNTLPASQRNPALRQVRARLLMMLATAVYRQGRPRGAIPLAQTALAEMLDLAAPPEYATLDVATGYLSLCSILSAANRHREALRCALAALKTTVLLEGRFGSNDPGYSPLSVPQPDAERRPADSSGVGGVPPSLAAAMPSRLSSQSSMPHYGAPVMDASPPDESLGDAAPLEGGTASAELDAEENFKLMLKLRSHMLGTGGSGAAEGAAASRYRHRYSHHAVVQTTTKQSSETVRPALGPQTATAPSSASRARTMAPATTPSSIDAAPMPEQMWGPSLPVDEIVRRIQLASTRRVSDHQQQQQQLSPSSAVKTSLPPHLTTATAERNDVFGPLSPMDTPNEQQPEPAGVKDSQAEDDAHVRVEPGSYLGSLLSACYHNIGAQQEHLGLYELALRTYGVGFRVARRAHGDVHPLVERMHANYCSVFQHLNYKHFYPDGRRPGEKSTALLDADRAVKQLNFTYLSTSRHAEALKKEEARQSALLRDSEDPLCNMSLSHSQSLLCGKIRPGVVRGGRPVSSASVRK